MGAERQEEVSTQSVETRRRGTALKRENEVASQLVWEVYEESCWGSCVTLTR